MATRRGSVRSGRENVVKLTLAKGSAWKGSGENLRRASAESEGQEQRKGAVKFPTEAKGKLEWGSATLKHSPL